MEKTNIAEILKDCPKGMELDCMMYEDVYLNHADETGTIYCYIQHETHTTLITFNKYGGYNSNEKSKCVIFPKGKTTWEGFTRPFKEGDIIYHSSVNDTIGILTYDKIGYPCKICEIQLLKNDTFNYTENKPIHIILGYYRFATEEEKQKLFNAIKANGYKWNAKTNTLEKLIQPKFKVGDWITFYGSKPFKILKVEPEQNGILNYLLLDSRGHDTFYDKKYVDENARFWTIEDAKDGDALCYKDEVFILKNYVLFNKIEYHCCYDGENFTQNSIYSLTKDDFNKIHPATKEQSDLLFTKMKEAGYELDAEKKELKIEQVELPNGEDYGIDGLYHAARILEETLGCVEGYQSDDGILEHKCAIEAVNRLYEQPSWGEEDEQRIEGIIATLNSCITRLSDYGNLVTGDIITSLRADIDWLKSTKIKFNRNESKCEENEKHTISNKNSSCTIQEKEIKDGNHHYVDLGLSVKWATCNVGATNPEDYGDYFAWGETKTKNEYTKENCWTYGNPMSDISGDARYDVARAKWGDSWRMPTKAEWDELLNKCQWEWINVNGIKGYKVIGLNGNSIFLPATGWLYSLGFFSVGVTASYWCSTPDEDNDYFAYGLNFCEKGQNGYWFRRCCGQSVRPVLDI